MTNIEHEVDRLANDLAADWRERAEKAEAEITVWKTRLVDETARLRDINRGAVEAIREIRKAALVGLTANDQTTRLYKGALARVVEITDARLGGR